MPMPTPEELWKLVADTGLADHDQIEGLRREFGRDSLPPGIGGAAVTELLAKWLVRRKVLTIWQARRLVRGDRGPFFLGDYRLLERLETSDAKGTLLRARHEPSGRGVCLMLLDGPLCRQLEIWTDIVQRTGAAHQASDPMTSRTWALEQSGSQRFIICEDVVGTSLAAELAAGGPLPITEAGPLLVASARAVAELHRLGVVHGGISLDSLRREPPANGGGNPPAGSVAPAGRVRLLQFPLVADPHVVPQRPPLDTPESIQRLGMKACFVAPELLLPASSCDARSDVYALGCVFHALLTGTPPCWQGDAQQSLSQAAFVGPPPLGPPRVPIEVATLISYMVAHDPAARYATAADAADAIALCLGMPAVSPTLPAQRPFIAAAAQPQPQPALAAARPPQAPPVQTGATAWEPIVNPAASVAPLRQRPAKPRRPRWVGLGLAAAAVVTAGAVAFMFLPATPEKPPTPAEPPAVATVDAPTSDPDPAASPPVPDEPPKPRPSAATETQIVDSETLPWASPTRGTPPTLAYLPPGSQLILLARPADITASAEGRLFLRALGPRVEQALELAAAACGCGPEAIDSIQAGWQAGGPDEVIGGYAISGLEPFPVAADPDLREAAWGKTAETKLEGETIHVGPSLAFWLPSRAAGQVLVAAPEKLLLEMLESDRQAAENRGTEVADDAKPVAGRQEQLEANLSPDLEALVGMLDSARHVTLFGSPNYLLHDGRPVFAGPLAKLIDPLGGFLGSDLQAAALSLHCGENFYIELDCIAPTRTPARKLADTLATKIDSLADSIENYCNTLDPHPYGRKLVMRLPRMLSVVAGSLRFGGEGRGVIVNCHLPEHAAHNLVLAAELAIEQPPGAATTAIAGQPAATATPQSARDRVQKKISLAFARDTLEKSIQMIADEIAMPIEIIGKDLELEGITKNQSFGLDERDQTADAVLRTILAKSNPDGKLVYVFRAKDGAELIEITTRAAAAKRGDTLPPGFEKGPAAGAPPEKPEKKKK